MTRHHLSAGRAGLLIGVSLLALQAQASEPTTPPDPPKFEAQTKIKYVSPTDILEFKALPAYHEPDWVTKNFVDTGKLPPVKDRLPKEPMVYKKGNMPDGIGVYGDTLRHVIGGRPEGWNYSAGQTQGWGGIDIGMSECLTRTAPLFQVKPEDLSPLPNLAKSWEWSSDGHQLTMHLIEGAKWSDGAPFNADDVMFYWDDNVGGMRALLQACVDVGVDRVLFSSSAAVYGTPPTDFVTEQTPTAPMSPYGESKLAGEWMLKDLAVANGLRWAALRYFNVAGAGAPELRDRSVSNLIPMTFEALSAGRHPQLFGDDYDTRDGSCIRDYIHVVDLAEAHVAAARRLDEQDTGDLYNVGRGEGVTVKEVYETVRAVTGIDFVYDVAPRRPGDPAAYFADPAKIETDLGWKARLDLEEMVRSAWEGWQAR